MTYCRKQLGLTAASLAALSWLGCAKSEPPRREPTPASQAQAVVPAAPQGEVPSPPASLGAFKTPKDNPTTFAKVRLGNQLFFDPALSVDGTRSCYSCHQNE